jgi:serine/threonine protein kinase
MASEQVCGEPLTAAADLYGVAVIFYEMLTGTTPFGGGTTSMLFERHLIETPAAPSPRCPDRTIPRSLDEAILRALEKAPTARHVDASTFATAIELAVPERCADRELAHARIAFSTTASTRDWIRSPRYDGSTIRRAPARRRSTRARPRSAPSATVLAHAEALLRRFGAVPYRRSARAVALPAMSTTRPGG